MGQTGLSKKHFDVLQPCAAGNVNSYVDVLLVSGLTQASDSLLTE
jgi:hypothetical protein